MIGAEVRGPTARDFDEIRRYSRQVHERAALRTVAVIANRGKAEIRRGFAGAGLRRLGNAIGATSDAEKGTIRRYGRDEFAVSAQFFVRSGSPRTRGAIEAYTEGAEIVPRRGRWLWIATDEIPQLVGSGKDRKRMTPALYRERGFEAKIGPLVRVRSEKGYPLLIVRGATVNAAGKPRKARALTKTGKVPRGQVRQEIIVAFIGIPRTARQARVSITDILRQVRAEVPDIFAREFAKEGAR